MTKLPRGFAVLPPSDEAGWCVAIGGNWLKFGHPTRDEAVAEALRIYRAVEHDVLRRLVDESRLPDSHVLDMIAERLLELEARLPHEGGAP